ncbi:hypothetical protein F5887DRAFT_672698 [Amanita rubescens]|nr:hypothetical protein F5887DRAFT_672698 [Amanita rubescens]
MTSRLKKKLTDIGVDVSSRKANENFCLIGTPLPPLEKSKDIGEFVPLWKQEVKDEKGRRRLHGAFTGGFSAGYFNTVGSKEGWTPSTFVSSRSDRAKKKVSRPEDFMDEEDLQEKKDSMEFVDTTDAMDLTGGAEAKLARQAAEEYEADPVRSALVQALIPPPKESAGAKVLKKMGWKPGQGIGPRISYRMRKLQDMQAVTGKVLKLADIVITEEEEEANKHKYPRRDVPVPTFERKDNFHGIGYKSGLNLRESLGRSNTETDGGPSISAGFGLGALNDADEDDIDVYDGGHNTSKTKIAYDIAERESDTVVLTKKKSNVESRRTTTYATFNNGLPVLPGFVIADAVQEDEWFPGPEVPPGWKSNPKRVWDSDPNKENIQAQTTKSEPLPYQKWKTGISAEERGSLLGEAPISSTPRSVFEYISQKDRERIQNITTGLAGPQVPMAPAEIHIPRTEPHTAQAALKGFQPFISDSTKHDRYTAYLLSQADPTSSVPQMLKPLPEQRTEEFNRELEDYAKAAAIFKPMTGAMAGRFTSAAIVEQGPQVREGLHTPSTEQLEKLEAEEKKREDEKMTPQQNAAKLGMYGPMTREAKAWQPARLLCKRFGVKEPEVQADSSKDVGANADTGATSTPSWQEQAGVTVPPAQDEPSSSVPVKRDLDNIGLGEDETQGADTLTYQRPSIDIFKAIFANDEDDEDDGNGGNESGEEDAKEGVNGQTADASDVTAKFFPEDQGPIDLSTFKPTFIPRDRKGKEKEKDKRESEVKEKKGKKDKKERKKKDQVLVSFEMEEEGSGLTLASKPSKDKDWDKERPKKKRKDKERRKDGNEEAMWETSATEIPQRPAEDDANKIVTTATEVATSELAGALGNTKGRKRAIDFM